MENAANYKPVADGWRNESKIAYVAIVEDHFFPETLNLEISFDEGEGCERPKARLPLLYCPEHMVVEWKDGVRTERKATDADQREQFAFLGRLFPAWAEFCRAGGHTTQEMLYWFEDNAEIVKATQMEYRVSHSTSGFPNAYVKDPKNVKSKQAKARVTKEDAITRAKSAFAKAFGIDPVAMLAAEAAKGGGMISDEDVPF